jgi:hypothetical protein
VGADAAPPHFCQIFSWSGALFPAQCDEISCDGAATHRQLIRVHLCERVEPHQKYTAVPAFCPLGHDNQIIGVENRR